MRVGFLVLFLLAGVDDVKKRKTDMICTGRIDGAQSPPSSRSLSPLETEERPHNKSVTFAPLSPTSTRTYDRMHGSKYTPTPPNSGTYVPPTDDYAHDQTYEDPSSGDPESRPHRRHRSSGEGEGGHQRRRRRRRNSDPSSDRPNQPSKHRRRNRNPSRSPSPASSSETEDLPPRFDKNGRPLDGSRAAGGDGTELVEKIIHDCGDVIDGRKSWKDLISGLMEGGGLGGGGPDRDSVGRRKRRG